MYRALTGFTTSPDDSFNPVVARNSEVLGSNPDRAGYLSSRLCIYTVLQTVQMTGVCSDVYCTVHHKELLKSLDKSRACPDFWLLSVAILP